jgi:hypothetical protein
MKSLKQTWQIEDTATGLASCQSPDNFNDGTAPGRMIREVLI